MARKRKKKQKDIFTGILAVALTMAALLLMVFSAPRAEAPVVTEPPVVTFPPLDESVYGPGDFGYVDGYLTCLAGESVLGIDVSSHQGQVDWAQVKAAGVEFVMIRLGYRGYTTGALCVDDYVKQNLFEARAAGLKIGVYFYSQAISVEEAREEAAFALKILGKTRLDMPFVYDWEYVSPDARTGNVDSRTLTDCTIAFCEAVEEAGYQPMVYFNSHLARDNFLLEELAEYPFWLAMYQDEMDFPYHVEMWQYTQTGSVPGIVGDVDIDLYLP